MVSLSGFDIRGMVDLVSLKGNAMFSGVFWGVYGLGMACLLMYRVSFCFAEALEFAELWVWLNLGVEMEVFGRGLIN